MQECCSYGHKSNEICENYSNGIKCINNKCEKRHLRTCRYYKCSRNGSCLYMHGKNMNVNEVIDQTDTINDMEEIDAV